MPSSKTAVFLAAVRVAFVAAGVSVAALAVFQLATMPPSPPDSDGFVHGMAVIVWGVIVLLALGLAAVGVSLPAVLGRDDRLGFGPWQRLALKAAGVLVAGGLVVGLGIGLLTGLQSSIFLWLGLMVLAVCVVAVTLVWRLGEALVGTLSRAA